MTRKGLDGLMRGVGAVVREYTFGFATVLAARIEVLERQSGSALVERIALLEQRLALAEALATMPAVKGEPGTSVTVDDLTPIVAAAVQKAVAALPAPINGQDAPPIDLDALASRAAALVPKPADGLKGQDGTSVSITDVAPLIVAEVSKAVAALPPAKDGERGKDGTSVDLAVVERLIDSSVTKAVSSLPAPKDGTSVTVEDVAPLIVAEVTKAVATSVSAIHVPKDGVSVASALIDRDGHLIMTFSDGSTKDVGAVVGRSVEAADVQRAVTEQLATWPKPTNGIDGLGFDDFTVRQDGLRTVVLEFRKGDLVKTFPLSWPVTIYRGVFDDGATYAAGDQVTYAGSQWIAKEACQGILPDEHMPMSARAWTLSAKRGREGKQGPKGGPGDKGNKGDKGDSKW